jgi:hypothetical protein
MPDQPNPQELKRQLQAAQQAARFASQKDAQELEPVSETTATEIPASAGMTSFGDEEKEVEEPAADTTATEIPAGAGMTNLQEEETTTSEEDTSPVMSEPEAPEDLKSFSDIETLRQTSGEENGPTAPPLFGTNLPAVLPQTSEKDTSAQQKQAQQQKESAAEQAAEEKRRQRELQALNARARQQQPVPNAPAAADQLPGMGATDLAAKAKKRIIMTVLLAVGGFILSALPYIILLLLVTVLIQQLGLL